MLGSRDFVERLRALAGPVLSDPPAREARQLAKLDAGTVLAAVAEYYDLEASALLRRYDRHVARAMAAWLCRRYTQATLSAIATRLGLSRADSVPGLVRPLEARLKTSPHLIRDVGAILQRLYPVSSAPSGETSTKALDGREAPKVIP